MVFRNANGMLISTLEFTMVRASGLLLTVDDTDDVNGIALLHDVGAPNQCPPPPPPTVGVFGGMRFECGHEAEQLPRHQVELSGRWHWVHGRPLAAMQNATDVSTGATGGSPRLPGWQDAPQHAANSSLWNNGPSEERSFGLEGLSQVTGADVSRGGSYGGRFELM